MEMARRRINKEIVAIGRLHKENIAVMHIEHNPLCWHANVKPSTGVLKDLVFHFIIQFPDDYPDKAPTVEIMAPLEGQNVTRVSQRNYVNLPILDAWDPSQSSTTQLFEEIESLLNTYACNQAQIEIIKQSVKKYSCKVTGHTFNSPVPPFTSMKNNFKLLQEQQDHSDSKTYVNNPSSEWQVAKATSGVGWGRVLYEAKLDKVTKVVSNEDARFMRNAKNICSCRFGWATDDSQEDAISGIFYGNGENSHIIFRSKTQIWKFIELKPDETFEMGDYIAAGIDFESNRAWFAKNGKKVGDPKGYALPDFLSNVKLYPVVGLQNSAVNLNFGTARKRVPDSDGFVTIDQHKCLSKTDYLWRTRKNVDWIKLFTNYEPDNGAVPIFSYLCDKDLRTCLRVCKDWQKVIIKSFLLERGRLRCFVSKNTLSDCILGLGIVVEYDSTGRNITKVSSDMDYISIESWERQGIRKSESSQIEYTHFLPLALNPRHAKKCVESRVYEKYLPKALPKKEIEFNPNGCLAVLTSLMNGAVQTLTSEGDEPSKDQTFQTLELFCHLHHLLLFLNAYFDNRITSVANERAEQCTVKEKTTFQEVRALMKDNLFDIGEIILQNVVVTNDFQFKQTRKEILLEKFDRDVPDYLRKYPELENTASEDPQLRLDKVMDCTVLSRRSLMLQIHFAVNLFRNVNRISKENSQDILLKEYDLRFGSPSTLMRQEIQSYIPRIYSVDGWGTYFENLGIKPQTPDFVNKILIKSVERAEYKKYFTPTKPEVVEYAEPDDFGPSHEAYEPPENIEEADYAYEERKIKKCTNFSQLASPLAASLKTVEPLPLQSEVLPLITSGVEMVVVVSPLGTGKSTLAAITIIHTLLTTPDRNQVLVLVPDKNQSIHFEEILRDVYIAVPEEELDGKHKKPLSVRLLDFGQPKRADTNILIGTPGRVSKMMQEKNIDGNQFAAVYLLDVDGLLSRRNADRTISVFSHVPMGIQTVVFSNSYSSSVQESSYSFLDEDAEMVVKTAISEENYKHWFVGCRYDQNKPIMCELLCYKLNFEQAIIFVGSGEKARNTAQALKEADRCGEVGYLHDRVDSEYRRGAVENFNNQKTKILVTQDHSLYGIKPQNVQVIIHVDMPYVNGGNAMDDFEVYEKRLANVINEGSVTHSICLSIRKPRVENLLAKIDSTYSLTEVPKEPSSIFQS